MRPRLLLSSLLCAVLTIVSANISIAPQVAAQNAGNCVESVRVAIDFERIKNIGNGNVQERVFFGNNSNQSVGDFQYIDLIQNGQYIVDSNVNRNVPGLSLERGAGFIRVNLFGRLNGAYPNQLEAVLGKVIFQNASIVSVGNGAPSPDEMEGQGNGTYDFSDVSPDDEVFQDGRFYVSVDTGTDTFIIHYNPSGPLCGQQDGECVNNVRVAIDFERVRNQGNGNTQERVFFGNNSNQSVGDFQYIDLIQNGQYIIDSNVNRNVPGLSLQRGAGFVRINLYGYLGGGYPNHFESVKGRVLFQNAAITSVVNDTSNHPLDALEGQGNGTFDSSDATPDDEAFQDGSFYVSVDSNSDTFIVYYNPNGRLCGEPNQCTTQQKYEYTFTAVTNGNFYSVAVGSQPGPAVTCVNNPPAGGWTLTDNECIASDSTVGCKSMVCQWQRPTTRSLEYSMSHWGAQYHYENVDCAQYPKAGYNLKSKVCVVPSTSGGCASDICFWERDGVTATSVSLSHYGSSAANRELADCRPFSNADRVERQCLLSAEHCLSDICLLSNNLAVSCPVAPQCRDGIDNDGDGLVDFPADPGCSNPDDNDETNQVQQGADLSITKSGPSSVTRGNTVSYTVTAFNAGPATATNVVVADVIPSGLTFNAGASSQGCALNGNGTSVLCNNFNLASGQSKTFTIAFNVPTVQNCSQTTIQNTATVSASSTDSNSSNNTSQVITTTVQCPEQPVGADLSIFKSGPSTVVRGNTASYTVSVFNGGPGTATNVVVADVIPAGLTFNAAASSQGCALNGAGTSVLCNNFNLVSGQSKTFTIAFNVPTIQNCTQGTIQNTATVSSSSTDPDPNDNISQTVTTTATCPHVPQCRDGIDNDGDGLVDFPHDPGCTTPDDDDEFNAPQGADLSITKSGPSTATRGGTISYTVTAFNAGPGAATNVVIADVIPAGLTFNATASSVGCVLNGNGTSVLCNNFNLAAGQSKTFTIVFNVPTVSQCNQTVVHNTATVSSSSTDPNSSNNFSSVVSTTVQCPFVPQCRDGIDNDGDGKIDFPSDPGCFSPDDNDEFNQPTLPQCSDGIDNDNDGKIDYFDPGCYPNGIFDSISYNPNDNDESNSAPNPNQCKWVREGGRWVRRCN